MATITDHEKAPAPELVRVERVTRRELPDILEKHRLWLDSGDENGTRADVSGKNLSGAELVDARLPDALLNKTILKGADLTLADLRGHPKLRRQQQPDQHPPAGLAAMQAPHNSVKRGVQRPRNGA